MCTLMNWLDRRVGNRALVLLLIVALCACSSLHGVPDGGSELRARIRNGPLARPGDVVRVTTTAGTLPEFRVTAVEDADLVGRDVRVPIESITAVEIRDHRAAKRAGKAALMAALGVVVVVAAVFLFASVTLSGMEFNTTGG